MPAAPCRAPLCPNYVERRGLYCAEHADARRPKKSPPARRPNQTARNAYFAQHRGNPAARRFYHSAAWQAARREKLAESPTCEHCGKAWARHVHHVKPLRDCDADEAIDLQNLLSLCAPCHNSIEARRATHAAAAGPGRL